MSEPTHQIHHADIKEWAKNYEGELFDGILCDPPYGWSFMGKSWDYDLPSVEVWRLLLDLLKPGAHILVACGTRTQHRMAVNIEDAGFELRDVVAWLYGSGFPKSLNIGKAVDKINGEGGRLLKFVEWYRTTGMKQKQTNEIIGKSDVGSHYLRLDQPAIPTREIWKTLRPRIPVEIPEWVDELVDRIERERELIGKDKNWGEKSESTTFTGGQEWNITKGTSEWEGYGTALKPAMELWTLARKPLEGTVANNVLKHGTGGLAIDNCRIKPANATDEPSNPLLSAQRTVFSDKPELAPSSLDEISSYSLDTLHDYFEHISSGQRAYNTVCTTPLRDVAFLRNTQNKQLLGVPCDYGQLVERVKQYENQGYEAQDFPSDYPTLHRLCDVYARQAKVLDQDVAPLLADVLSYIRSVQQESLHNPDYSSQYLLLVLVVFAYDLLRSILPYDYTTSSTANARFPANLIHDGSDEVEAVFPQTGKGAFPLKSNVPTGKHYEGGWKAVDNGVRTEMDNGGSASRYFYCAKASKSERNAGLEGFEERLVFNNDKGDGLGRGISNTKHPSANHHPTVKPLSLTKYLATLIKPPTGGRLLVPFSGSGSEMIGALQAGWGHVEGVELTEEYIPIAEARIKYWLNEMENKPKQEKLI